jgi:3-hydroxyisobutyrate dehydrogenase
MSSSSPTIGLVGLGIIGSRVRENLYQKGFSVAVWNRTVKAVPSFVPDPLQLAEQCQQIHFYLGDDQAFYDVLTEMDSALTPDHVLVNHSTLSLDFTHSVARVLKARGIGFLDVPFTGSKVAAEQGQLVYYASGEEKLIEKIKPVLLASGKNVIYLGAIGQATLLKLVTNLISAVTVQALAEAAQLCEKNGINLELLKLAIQNNANHSLLMDLKMNAALSKDFAPHFSIKNMLKDCIYARQLNQNEISTPSLDAAIRSLRNAYHEGYADADYAKLLDLPQFLQGQKDGVKDD